MKNLRENVITVCALLISAALHAMLIGGICMGLNGGGNNVDRPVTLDEKRETIDVSFVKILPYVPKVAEHSELNSRKGAKAEETKKEDFGTDQKQQEINSATDNESEMLSYNDSVKQRIQASRRYPEEARRRGVEGNSTVSFWIGRNGEASGVTLEKSSGDQTLDTEAMATIWRASPFPALPQLSLTENRRLISTTIVFKLNYKD
jgi:TonB family protein